MYRYQQAVVTCHKGNTEVYKNLFLGAKADVVDIASDVDILIPLDSLPLTLFDTMDVENLPEIMYIPIEDFGVLPNKKFEEHYVNKIIDLLKEGKKIWCGCVGSHGRSPYLLAMVLGRLGVEDPIAHLREKHCPNCIETNEQLECVADFLGKRELLFKHYDMNSQLAELGNWGVY